MQARTIIVGLCLLVLGSVTKAATYTWVGGGDNNWFTAAHWNGSVVPDDYSATVYVNNGGTAQVPGGDQIHCSSLTLGNGSGQTGTMSFMGPTSSGVGTIYVGQGGTGTLNVLNGSSMDARGASTIGAGSTGHGTVVVDGGGSLLYADDNAGLTIGDQGTGALTISNGGTVSPYTGSGYHPNFTVGKSSGGTGTVLVTGSGSKWNCNAYTTTTYIGGSGTGTVTVQNGAGVSNSYVNLGNVLGSNGTLKVTGAGSWWTTQETTSIGECGRGTLSLEAGAGMSSGLSDGGATYLGHAEGANGSATITGSGSLWQTAALHVAYEGSGTLTINNGGHVQSTDIKIGVFGTGTATVDGSGSRLECSMSVGTAMGSGYTVLAQQGTGTLNITNGAYASSYASWLGWYSGSLGTVNVSGAGTQWYNSKYLEIGHSAGQGVLNVTAGAWAHGSDIYLGNGTGASGTATVDGASSQLDASNNFDVGTVGTGSLTASNGGLVSIRNTVTIGAHGVVLLNGGNLNAGNVVVLSGGTLKVTGADGRTPDSMNVTVQSGGVFQINGVTETLGGLSGAGPVSNTGTLRVGWGDASSTFTGTLTGSGALDKLGNGTFTMNNSNTFAGALSIEAGVLQTGAGDSLGGSTRVTISGGTLQLLGAENFGSLAGTGGTVDTAGYDLGPGSDNTDTTFAGGIVGNGGLTKYGTGVMTLTGESTFKGVTTVSTGTLRVTGADERLCSSGSVSVSSGATFQVDSITQTIGALTGAGQVSIVNGGALQVNPTGSMVFSGSISGDGRLVKLGAGTLSLTGNNSAFANNFTSEEGTLETGPIVVGGHSTGTFCNTGGTHTMSNSLYVGAYSDGTGRYELSGTGSLSTLFVYLGMHGVGTFAQSGGSATVTQDMYLGYWPDGHGTLNLGGGTMNVGGSLIVGGGSMAGGAGLVDVSGGSLTVTGALTVWPGGTIQVDLGGLIAANAPANIVVGTADLGGTLDVTLIGGFQPQIGELFHLFQWNAAPSGTFGTIDLPDLAPGLIWDTSTLYSTGDLSVIPEPATLSLLALGGLAMLRRKRK